MAPWLSTPPRRLQDPDRGRSCGVSTLTLLEIGAYALASVLYLGYLLGLRDKAGRLALGLAVLSLFEDRKLRRKEFGPLRGRATPLETLDRLASRCVSVGFPIFTVAIVTGAMWIARLGVLRRPTAFRPEYLIAVVTWVA